MPQPADATMAIDRALDLLFHLHASPDPRGVSSLGRDLGMPKSTVHRLLQAFVRRGLLERTEAGRYRPGTGLLALAHGVLDREPIVAIARPVLEAEAARLGETLFLARAVGGRLVVLDKHEGSGFLRAAPRIGAEIPAHATAIGKVYLALAPETIEGGIREAYTTATRTDASALERELADVRRDGVAHNDEEWIPGLAGVAAPVRCRGRLAGAIAVSGSVSRFDRPHFARAVALAADTVGRRLEGAPQAEAVARAAGRTRALP